jgi:hypothetical protein
MINVVLSGLTRSRCFVSLDDVVYVDIPPSGADENGYQDVSFGPSGLVQKTKSDYQIRKINIVAYRLKAGLYESKRTSIAMQRLQ